MNLMTNLKMAINGYSIDDIKEISKIEGMTDEMANQIAENKLSLDDIKALVEVANDDTVVYSGKPEEKEEEKKEEEVDYKKLYEEEKGKLENAQKENLKKDIKIDNPRSGEEQLLEWVASFME